MMHAFLLIGQSNMAGRGFLAEAVPVDTSRIYILRNGRWQNMFRPINPDRSFSGSSLAESFAEYYAKKHDVDVGLICCADGGTTLDQWMPGSLLYDHAVMNARLAQRTSTIAGILWHQGESDCAMGRYETYQDKLLQMLNCLRKDLDLGDVPVLLGGLGDFLVDRPASAWELQHSPFINEALRSVAAMSEMTGFVPATGLGCNPDMLHFNAAALHEFGQRYFAEYEKLIQNRKPVQSQKANSDTLRSEMELL